MSEEVFVTNKSLMPNSFFIYMPVDVQVTSGNSVIIHHFYIHFKEKESNEKFLSQFPVAS